MKLILTLALLASPLFGAFPDNKTEPRFHCYTRVTYRHYVYSNGCYANNEILIAVISQTWPNKVLCGKLEVDCFPNLEGEHEKSNSNNEQ